MKIINQTSGNILATDAKKAESFIDRALGLLIKNNPRSLVFDTHFGLHTFGMMETIDIIVVSNAGKVVKFGENIRPNSIFLYNPVYRRVIELPAGIIKTSKTGINDKITFE